ncbi:predicted protein [Botrytis cinerea T4]|uniref:Uncharacterized protein n=1 Tax=Botryotinia fuckeliana (strain T4) TaxID=999810 RepID=G2Y9R1_BOTF4|nr:predicted protein [Botrytis cinerea T4]
MVMGIENASVVLNIHFQFVVMSLESHASPKKPFEITTHNISASKRYEIKASISILFPTASSSCRPQKY